MKQQNQRKALLFTLLALGICAGTLLIDRFLIEIPDWIAIISIVLALIFMFLGFFNQFKKRKE